MKPSNSNHSATTWLLAFIAGISLTALNLHAQNLPCVETNGVKFLQLPQIDGGQDVRDSGGDVVLADDFFCNTTGPITDIHLWGSWLNDVHGTITNFWIGIYSDVPAVTNFSSGTVTPSHPGTNLLWQQTFGLGQYSESTYGSASETFYDPVSGATIGTDATAWYYCFYPTNPFVQQGTAASPTNYWLAVYALVAPSGSSGPQGLYGWKTAISNYNDPAVWGNVGAAGTPIGNWQSMTNTQIGRPFGLAFMLTTPTNPPPPPGCIDNDGAKYVQLPNFQGLDVWNNGPYVLADDFVCTNTGPISDIHLWGSWLGDQPPDTNIGFWIAIYDDVPVNATNNFSHPGNLLWNEQFTPGQYIQSFWGTGSESFLDPGPPNNLGPESNIWYYCFYPTNIFTQQGSASAPKIYWLMVYASGTTRQYGWKTTTVVSNDVSVHAPWPGSPPIGNPGWTPTLQSPTGGTLDLAFKLTTATNIPPPPPPCTETNGIKYIQPPQSDNGYDVWNSSSLPPGVTDGPWLLADDFVCTNTGPITDIHIWGSWLNNQVQTNTLTFWLAMFQDVPANPPAVPNSQPGALIWEQCFAPGQYAESLWSAAQENFMDPGPPSIIGTDSQIWYYCFYPTNPPIQQGTTAAPKTYWLGVFAQAPAGAIDFFGWKTTTNVQNDISVHTPWNYGICPTNITTAGVPWTPNRTPSGAPLDLAFMLTTPTNTCVVTVTCSTVTNKTVPCGSSWAFDPPVVGQSPCCPNPTVLFTAATNIGGPCSETTTGTWIILDCSSNFVGSCTETVNVVDTNAPVFNGCVPAKTVACGSSWSFDTPTATYVCSGSNAVVGLVSSNYNAGGCTNMATATWEATNACSGAVATCIEVVSIVATNPPIMTCATNKTVINGSTWTFDPPTAVDACSGSNLPVTVIGTVTNGSSPCNETFTRTWEAVDACNNTNFCSQTVTNVCPPVVCVESDREKYVQGPNIIGGYDVWNTPYVLADDFVCTNRGPVSDIHIWGSWLSNNALTNTINFWLGIYDDVPAVTNGPIITPSHPGTNLLWQQWFYPGQYAETIWSANAEEQFLDPGASNVIGADSVVWYFCFYPTNAFEQLGTPTNHIIYWLAAYAQLPTGTNLYGWKTTTNVLNDTSVHAVWPGVPPINNPGWTPTAVQPASGGPAVPLDLAFKITSCGPVTISNLPPTNVVVTWEGGGHLQSAINVQGPYTDVPGAPTSPYIDTVVPTRKFYRLRCYP